MNFKNVKLEGQVKDQNGKIYEAELHFKSVETTGSVNDGLTLHPLKVEDNPLYSLIIKGNNSCNDSTYTFI